MNINVTPAELDLMLAFRLIIALLLGGLLGYDRERTGKPAGLRTYALVSLGAALFGVVSIYGFSGMGDTGRVAAQVVTGIGFLGGGAILRYQGDVHGLTTAAGFWVAAAVGLAAGVGLIVVALLTAMLAFVVLGAQFRINSGPQGYNVKDEKAEKDGKHGK